MKLIKKYNNYIAENMMFDEDTIIEILKSLKNSNNNDLINKIINKKDNNGKTLLMNVVETNDENMIDYILHFNPNINEKNKNGENILFYCKNLKMVNKFIEAGADVTAKNEKLNRNLLVHLANRKICNVELYKKIMSKGVDLKNIDDQKQTVLSGSILNKSMLQFLIDNNVDLNGDDKYTYLSYLCYTGRYVKQKSTYFINTLKVLLKNGMKIDEKFINLLIDNFKVNKEKHDIFDIFEIIDAIKEFFNDRDALLLWQRFKQYNNFWFLEISKRMIRMFESPNIYAAAKEYWRNSYFEEKFADIIKEFPYFDYSDKYNL